MRRWLHPVTPRAATLHRQQKRARRHPVRGTAHPQMRKLTSSGRYRRAGRFCRQGRRRRARRRSNAIRCSSQRAKTVRYRKHWSRHWSRHWSMKSLILRRSQRSVKQAPRPFPAVRSRQACGMHATMPGRGAQRHLDVGHSESVAGSKIAIFEAHSKPLHALCRGAVRKAVRNHLPAGLFLQAVVAYGSGGA